MLDDEVGKYKKNKHSARSKAKKKSDHKHILDQCLVRHHYKRPTTLEPAVSYYRVEFCKICGKITNTYHGESKKIGSYYMMISDQEFLEKYSYLPILDHYGEKNKLYLEMKYVDLEQIKEVQNESQS